jgi:hypothetical protein
MSSSSKKSNSKPSSDISQSQPSSLYFACRNGDVKTVTNLLSQLTKDDLDQIEPNGSTALHAASYYGHTAIVRLLLNRGCSTTIQNKFDKTPMDEAANEEIHQLFVKQQNSSEYELEDDSPPKSDRLEIYPNLNNKDKSNLATCIAKTRLRTYRIHKYQIEGVNNTAQLERIFKKHVSEKAPEAEEAMIVLQKFRETKNTVHLVELYLMETFVYKPPIIDDTFLIEMYVNLTKFSEKPFRGILYSGHRATNEHLDPYRWAFKNSGSLLETRRVLSTSLEWRIAKMFAKSEDKYIGVIFTYDFPNECYTVMNLNQRKNDLRSLEYFEYEQEAIILPGTFFAVTSISEPKKGFLEVRMINIPIERDVLMSEINALH